MEPGFLELVGRGEIGPRLDDQGVLRVGPSRVAVDVILEDFDLGMSPEAIVNKMPALRLQDVYATFGSYIEHRPEYDAYLARRRTEAQELRQQIESATPPLSKAQLIERQKKAS